MRGEWAGGVDLLFSVDVSTSKGGKAMQDITPGVTSTPAPSEQLVKELSEKAAGSSGWMKFLGVLMVIYGVFLIFSIWGILICWLPIWLGILLFRAAGDAELASRGAPKQLLEYVRRLNRYFMIQGILALIGVIVFLVAVFVVGLAALSRFWGLF